MSLEVAPPRFPEPPARFDRDNEAQFRREVERALVAILQAGGGGSSGSSGAPVDSQYVVVATDATLTAERALAVGPNLAIADGGAGTTVTVSLSRARGTDVLTTASVADLAEDTGVWDIGCSMAVLMSLQADKACRVRLYDTSAHRTADVSRGLSTDPTAGQGVLAEYVFTAANTYGAEPPIILKNGDSSPTNEVYYAVQNRSGSTGAVTLTAKLVALEE